jgi:hypothetical protein
MPTELEDDATLLTDKQKGWGLFWTGAALGITAAWRGSGLIAAIGALGASCTAAAAVFGVSAARSGANTTGGRT